MIHQFCVLQANINRVHTQIHAHEHPHNYQILVDVQFLSNTCVTYLVLHFNVFGFCKRSRKLLRTALLLTQYTIIEFWPMWLFDVKCFRNTGHSSNYVVWCITDIMWYWRVWWFFSGSPWWCSNCSNCSSCSNVSTWLWFMKWNSSWSHDCITTNCDHEQYLLITLVGH